MIAYDYPLLGLWWTMVVFFIWCAWIMLLFRTFGDIFRNPKLGGWAKGLWSVFIILVPLLGVLVYLIAHGDGIGRRDFAEP